MRKIIVLLVLILIFGFVHPIPVYACSGGGYSLLNETLKFTEIVVTGRFVELDDLQLNGIFEVDQYIFGDVGPRYLLLGLNSIPLIQQRLHSRFISGQCNLISEFVNTSDTYIMFLRRNIDGSYAANRSDSFGSYFRFLQPSQKISVIPFYDADETTYDIVELTFPELITEIERQTGGQAQFPIEEIAHPLTAPILLSTNAQQHYLLPVDFTSPVAISDEETTKLRRVSSCYPAPCTAYSSNGLDMVALNQPTSYPNYIYGGANFVGEAASISPTNESVAIWDGQKIDVFALYYPILGYSNTDRPELVNTLPLDSSDYPEMVWSPDGRMLAYTDQRGLWLWDVFTPDSEPRLLIVNKRAVARYFSPLGRYLAVKQGKAYFNFDTVSGKQFPDGLISPDDRLLLVFDTTDTGEFPFTVESLVRRKKSDRENMAYQVAWINEHDFLASWHFERGCGDGGCWEAADAVSKYEDGVLSWLALAIPNTPVYGYQFDYHPPTGSIVSLIDGDTIAVNGIEHRLEGEIEGEITQVEWLPSLFYYADE